MNIQLSNPLGAYMGGMAMGQQAQEFRQENALRDLFAAQGAGIAAGDEGALTALAAIDPMAALGVRDTRSGMAARDAGVDISRQNLGISRERLGMERERLDFNIEQARLEAQQAAAQIAAEADAQEVLETQQATRALFAGGSQAARSGSLDRWRMQNAAQLEALGYDPAQITEETWPIMEATLVGADEGFGEALETIQGMQGGESWQTLSPQDAQAMGFAPGTVVQRGPDGQLQSRQSPPTAGMGLRVTPEGGVEFTQGNNVSFTEGQSKDNVYATQMAGSLAVLDEQLPNGQYRSDLLVSRSENLAESLGGVTMGLSREAQSPEFQAAAQAGQEFLTALLRKQTGAAVTEAEFQIYGSIYLPQPGDSPEVLARKRQARQRALDAIEAGMNADQIRARDAALVSGGSGEAASQSQGQQDFSQMSLDDLLAYDVSQIRTQEQLLAYTQALGGN